MRGHKSPENGKLLRNTKSSHLDIPLVVMGFMFIAMPIAEYFTVGVDGEERLIIKGLNGAQAAFALLVTFSSGKAFFISRKVPRAFLFLLIWVCVYEAFYAVDLNDMFYTWILYLYWFTLLIFFCARAYNSPDSVPLFLVMAMISLALWIPVLEKSVTVSMDANRWDYRIAENRGYYAVAMFPYILMLKKKWLKVAAISIVSFVSVYSLKRGVVLALVLMGGVSAFLYLNRLSTSVRKVRSTIAVVALFVVAISSAFIFLQDHTPDAIRRLEADTGRERIYSDSLEAIKDGDLVAVFLGNVDKRITEKVGILPHNDWLYLLHDYGLFSVILMLNIYIALWWLLKKLLKMKSRLLLPLVSAMIMMFCLQAYSFGFFRKIFGIVTGSIGIVLGLYYYEIEKEIRKMH